MRCIVLLVLLLSCHACAAVPQSACADDELIVWSCVAEEGKHAVCASRELSESAGYLQYRATAGGESVQAFPDPPMHPAGLFAFSLLPRGAVLSFVDDGKLYQMWEGLEGLPSMTIARDGATISTTQCTDSDHMLTLTDTINLLEAAGVAGQALATPDGNALP